MPEAKRLRWDAAEVVATLRALPHDGPSEHGGGGYRQRILLDESASSGGKLGRKRAYAPGSRIIEELRRVGDDRVAAIFTMTKLPRGESPSTGDWRFEILDGELRVAADGDLSSCSRCHLEAENDSVFEPLLEATAAPRLDAMK